MDWEKLSKTNRILLMILPPIVLIVLFSSIYMLPTLDNIKKLKNDQKNIQEDIEKANIIVSKYEDLKALNEKLQKKMEFLKTLLPKETEVTDVLKMVSQIGLNKGLVVTSWKPKEKTVHSSNEIYEIPVEVGMKGKYHTFGTFFADITRIERIVNIKKMEIKKGDKDPTMLNANLTAVTYSLIPEEEKKKIQQKKK
ncbi:type IV pilus assembly protein PilO [Thermodesulfovibrio aggregans]|uniref:Type IV pilus assembly protein PilO n=1 Tax=Thermodesulfovibrio aggregans TaxID=86166 RepID=A0A0U9HTR4_9BACT|nr:type 4a pilus biogenesis protein PilO [Thermodesulfovibrio aggregans]GAQ95650.1 type IV pilus assembly protein PilO [Thermodesulfovibrio aggregans]